MSYSHAYYEKNRSRILLANKKSRERHPETAKAWRLKNKDKQLAAIKKWQLKNKDQFLRGQRDYSRKNRVQTTKGHIYGKKRPYPESGQCELCGKVKRRLHYHHYDDEDLMKGFWVCVRCHDFVEVLEQFPQIIDVYLKLKGEVCYGRR